MKSIQLQYPKYDIKLILICEHILVQNQSVEKLHRLSTIGINSKYARNCLYRLMKTTSTDSQREAARKFFNLNGQCSYLCKTLCITYERGRVVAK